jgi:RNA polymerase sigma-70 factor (ECF subfamily)
MVSKEEKFKQLVEDNKSKLLRICRYYAPSVEDQKDMYQEILINIWKSLDSFRGESQIATWIYRIAVNTSLGFAGKQYKRMKLNVDIETRNLSAILIEDNDEYKVKEEQ